MLWYLLSPLRGTTQPPRLSANHPIRRAFYRHGKTTAQHWLVAMLVSVAIAMGFSYPTFFLSDDPTAGLAAFPRHVWTTAKPLDDAAAKVDVEMRQVWLHGSYMHALDKKVLKQALTVQQRLVGDELSTLGPALGDKFRSGELQWGYHSPLMYWRNSAELIDADEDILKTINEQRHTSSSLNVILRPASVFAGKRFNRRQLLAADALVLTFMNRVGDGFSSQWPEKMQSLPCDDCTLFPKDGHVTRNRVYEFSFTPLSVQEHIALTVAYSFMALYVLLSLRRMKAFHSRFGLVVTAVTQITCSILASFTICGLLKINLSTIPQNAYPFIVLVLGVENIFRLINAVLAYPPTMATELRIANALADIGPISVATVAQNLTILSLLSAVVSPGVAAFCAFAAIATLFDIFFLLTFFVAVLNVDIRRLELQDALAARHNLTRHRRRHSPVHHTWFDALVQGRLPFSTRMAGTAVTTTFILSLNYHFFEHNDNARNLRHLFGLLKSGSPSMADFETFAPAPMNATLTPTEWIHMQDFDTAKEVMRLAKPGSDSFVIRLYAPLVVVLGGSDRSGVPLGEEAWAQALRSFTVHHFYPVAIAIVFAVAFVAVLMNFLLYNEAGDEENDLALEELEHSLTIHTVVLPHRLDVVKIASSDSGHFITAALDRSIAISIADLSRKSHTTMAVPSSVLEHVTWPLHHLAIDNGGEWIACHCANDGVLAYNCATGSYVQTLLQYPDDSPAMIFTFVTLPSITGNKLYFIVLTSGARLAMSCLDDGKSSGADLAHVRIVGAALVDLSSQGRQLVIVAETGVVISHTWNGEAWVRTNTAQLQLGDPTMKLLHQVGLQLYSDLEFELLIVTLSHTAVFFDVGTLSHVATLILAEADTEIKQFLVASSRKCPECGGLALRKVATLAKASTGDACLLTNWTADDDVNACICLSRSSERCRPLESALKEEHTIIEAGEWTVSSPQTIIGFRKCKQTLVDNSSVNRRRPTTSELRQRRHARQKAQSSEKFEQWEAYRCTIDGDMKTVDLTSQLEDAAGSRENALYVNCAGPIVRLDSQGVAVGFGNNVQVIQTSRRGSIATRAASPSLERRSSSSLRPVARKAR